MPARLVTALHELHSLTALVLWVEGLTVFDLASLMSISMPRSRHLNVGDCYLKEEAEEAWGPQQFAAFKPNTSLTSLVLPTYDTENNARSVDALLQRHTQLLHLCMSGECPQQGASAPSLTSFSHTLTSLDVRSYVLDLSALLQPSSGAPSSSAAVLLPRLTDFSWHPELAPGGERLDHRELSDSLVVFLSHYGSRLQCLDLDANSMKYQRVLVACLACPELRLLMLHARNDCSSSWRETNEDVARLAAALPASYTPLVHLRTVSLQGLFLAEAHLLSVVAAFPAVTHLRLRGMQNYTVLPLSLSGLPAISRTCPRLQHLEITQIADTFFLRPVSGEPVPAQRVALLSSSCSVHPSVPFPELETLVVDRMVYDRPPERCLFSVPAVASFVSLFSASPLRRLFFGLSLSLSELGLLAPLRSLCALGRGQPSDWRPHTATEALWHPIPARFVVAAEERDRLWMRAIQLRGAGVQAGLQLRGEKEMAAGLGRPCMAIAALQ